MVILGLACTLGKSIPLIKPLASCNVCLYQSAERLESINLTGSCCNKDSTGGPVFAGFPDVACQHLKQIEQDSFIACLFCAINNCTCDYDLLFKNLFLVQVLYWQLQGIKVISKLKAVQGPASSSNVESTLLWINHASSSMKMMLPGWQVLVLPRLCFKRQFLSCVNLSCVTNYTQAKTPTLHLNTSSYSILLSLTSSSGW